MSIKYKVCSIISGFIKKNNINKVVLEISLTWGTVLFCMQPLLELAFFMSLFLMRAVVC